MDNLPRVKNFKRQGSKSVKWPTERKHLCVKASGCTDLTIVREPTNFTAVSSINKLYGTLQRNKPLQSRLLHYSRLLHVHRTSRHGELPSSVLSLMPRGSCIYWLQGFRYRGQYTIIRTLILCSGLHSGAPF
jgi:hypothetical protein